jgi:hypothetical protein
LGYDVVRTIDIFESSYIGIAKQNNLNKDCTGESIIAGERINVDIGSI